jgi:demethylmenaquinone methyltransferase/2-methoxy-6-polyprenyl-1,4-benzoquinol methylase
MFGFNEPLYKRQTITALDLKQGDTVVDIGCGTGLNFLMLQEKIGPSGRIIGVDLTSGMLAEAARRVDENGWGNVMLVQSDAAEYEFPRGIDAVLSTFALTFVPGFERVIENAFAALRAGSQFALLDMCKPEGWPDWLIRPASLTTRAFGVTPDLSARRPSETLQRVFGNVAYTRYYMGFIYSAIAQKG